MDSTAYPPVVEDRVVFTYWHDGRPRGVITGYWWHGGQPGRGFFVEHVIVFPGEPLGTLPEMVVAALRTVRAHGADYVGTYLATGYNDKLESLVKRFQFTCYAVVEDGAYYVRRV